MIFKQKWQDLLAQLEILENQGWGIWSEERLLAFETETGIILPAGYKEFCQIFGRGMLGDYMRISYPNLNDSNGTAASLKDTLDLVAQKVSNLAEIQKTLDSAFFFADNSNAHLVFWDLRTYSESDRSYDIYITYLDCFEGEFYQIGRDFFEFVRDFCLGMKSYEVLPEWMHPYPEELTLTFCPFKSPSESELAQLEEERQQHLIWQNNWPLDGAAIATDFL